MHANPNTHLLAADPDAPSAIRWLIDLVFPKRLHRMAYFVRGLLADIVALSLYSSDTTTNPAFWWLAAIALAAYILFFIVLPRMRDLEMNGWWLLAVFVPFVNIGLALILLFRPPQLHLGEPSRASEEKDLPAT